MGNVAGDTYIMTTSGSGFAAGDGYAYVGSTFQNVGQIRGPAGANGAQGPAGAMGAAGATGAKGDKGDTGLQGPAGAQGAAGSIGPKGDPGPAGANGTNGTNGVDAMAPAGGIMHFAMASPPTGWLKANGASLSRAAYPALFAAVGTTFGSADANSFNLPDLRGEFLRGFDDGRGADASRVFGTLQQDLLRDHLHFFAVTGTAGGGNAQYAPVPGSGTNFSTSGVNSGGGVETRPRNIALLACIKY
jgi:hypothetical protein